MTTSNSQELGACFILLQKMNSCELLYNGNKWDKVFKSGPSKVCGIQPLKNFKGYGLLKQILLGPLLNTLS